MPVLNNDTTATISIIMRWERTSWVQGRRAGHNRSADSSAVLSTALYRTAPCTTYAAWAFEAWERIWNILYAFHQKKKKGLLGGQIQISITHGAPRHRVTPQLLALVELRQHLSDATPAKEFSIRHRTGQDEQKTSPASRLRSPRRRQNAGSSPQGGTGTGQQQHFSSKTLLTVFRLSALTHPSVIPRNLPRQGQLPSPCHVSCLYAQTIPSKQIRRDRGAWSRSLRPPPPACPRTNDSASRSRASSTA